MLLCTAYLTGTIIALGLPPNADRIEPWKELGFCPLVDVPLVAASLPQVQAGFERAAFTLEQQVRAALVSAAVCPGAENCVSDAATGDSE